MMEVDPPPIGVPEEEKYVEIDPSAANYIPRARASRYKARGPMKFMNRGQPTYAYGYGIGKDTGFDFKTSLIPEEATITGENRRTKDYKRVWDESGEQIAAKKKMLVERKFTAAFPSFARSLNSVYQFLTASGIDNDFRMYGKNFFIGNSYDPISKRFLSGYKEGIATSMLDSLNKKNLSKAAILNLHFKTAQMLKRFKDFRASLASLSKAASEAKRPTGSSVMKMYKFATAALNPPRAMVPVSQAALTQGVQAAARRKETLLAKVQNGTQALQVMNDVRNSNKNRSLQKRMTTLGYDNPTQMKVDDKNITKSSALNSRYQGINMGMQPSMGVWGLDLTRQKYEKVLLIEPATASYRAPGAANSRRLKPEKMTAADREARENELLARFTNAGIFDPVVAGQMEEEDV
jgi:hypothetical protein